MRTVVPIAVVGVALVALILTTAPGRDGPAPAARPLWTSSRVVGSPDPPAPFRTVRAFPKVKLHKPLDLQPMPDGKRWLVADENGMIHAFRNDPEADRAEPFLDLSHANEHRLWSLTFHPKFAQNGYLYVCYHIAKPDPQRCRISRFVVDAKKGTCDLKSEFIVCEWNGGVDHWGGCLKFGPDGMLYFSAGDGHGYADGNESGQDLSDFQASILRIDVDRTDKYKGYAIPKDNPFATLLGARPEIWAYGMRNIWKMSFDRKTGDLWACDVGQDLWEPVIRVEKGGNYGWSVVEGTHSFRPNRKVGPTPILKPVYEHEHSEARSLTGGFVYRGQKFPELDGRYVYADYETGKVWALTWDGTKATEVREIVDTPYKLVAFAEDADGELLLLDHMGSIQRLERNPDIGKPSDFPRKLSQTGLFRSTRDHEPDPGLIPYTVNSPLWSDGSHKDRFIALPGEAKIDFNAHGHWGFPDGTVLVKTFALDTDAGRRRLETRLLHLEQNHWRGYTYLWNDARTDAELLEDPRGRDRTFEAAGGREQTWHFPSRAECTLCHTMPVGFVLGVNSPQMNKGDQLQRLERLGAFKNPLPKNLDGVPKLPDPHDTKAALDARARSYLHANCAHCHVQWGGGNALFELPFDRDLERTRTIHVAPQHGDLGIAGAKLLVPGDPDRSLLLKRMALTDERRMPRVASSVRDEAAVRLIEEWIRQMPVRNP